MEFSGTTASLMTRMGMGAMEHSTEGLGEGHWSKWEAMRKEDNKRLKKTLTFMNVFNSFYLTIYLAMSQGRSFDMFKCKTKLPI